MAPVGCASVRFDHAESRTIRLASGPASFERVGQPTSAFYWAYLKAASWHARVPARATDSSRMSERSLDHPSEQIRYLALLGRGPRPEVVLHAEQV